MSERTLRREHQRRIAGAKRRALRRAGIAAGVAGAFGLAAPAAQAANFEVNTLADHAPDGSCDTTPDCTLREAIILSNGNSEDDTITFHAGLTGTIRLDGTQGPLTVNTSSSYGLNIEGPGKDVISISGDSDNSGGPNAGDTTDLYFDGAAYLDVSKLTFTDGYGGFAGAIYVKSTGPGPGLYGPPMTLSDSAVTNSTASGDSSSSGPASFYGSGGGILSRGRMTITNSEISGNQSTATGVGPASYYGGGGIQNAGRMTIQGSSVTGNTAASYGGGIWEAGRKYGGGTFGDSLDVSNSTISGNKAQDGAGIGIFGIGKYGPSRGNIVNTTISGNHAYESGAGIDARYAGSNQHWNVSHTTISGNTADAGGGGLYLGLISGTFGLVDTTVSGNTAEYGGGVYLNTGAQKYTDSTTIDNSTIAGNGATDTDGGGGIASDTTGSSNYLQPTPLNSTIVADNTSAGAPDDLNLGSSPGPGGGAFDSAFSLVEKPGNARINNTSSIFGVDPQIGGLASNGGATQTMLPSNTSPVIDKGHSPTGLRTDQRGGQRTVDTAIPNAPGGDGTDIGSVELGAVPVGPKVQLENRKARKVRTRKRSKRVEISFTADQPGAKFQCQVDKGKFKPCTSPFKAKLKSGRGKGKLHTITIRAIDATGTATGPPLVYEVRVVRIG
jgi:CSLREA domain-containing protein